MDIQEIREGIARWFWEKDKKRNNLYLDGIGVIHYSDANQILSCLAEKGACFPVEGELPKNPYNGKWVFLDEVKARVKLLEANTYARCQQDYAGYKKVITLKEMMGGD